jgi:MFS family permease
VNTSLLAAFRNRTFAMLWIATFVSNIGSWMYGAAAGWLMTSLTKDAFLVSLVQVASSAPVFLLALVAGALSDIVDRRRLLIWGESVTAVLSAVFAAVVWMNWVTPASLLWFMFLISVSGALVLPTWQAGRSEARTARTTFERHIRERRFIQSQSRDRAGTRRRYYWTARNCSAVYR